MKTPREIYEAYQIMPALQLHQLRVAAVAQMICDHIEGPIDTRTVVLTTLFHDMGNIIKSKLDRFPEFLEPQGREYWEGVKAEYVKKYGDNQHAAGEAIAKEIGLPEQVVAAIPMIAFSNLEHCRDTNVYEEKIVEYADQRVGPYGILSMRERIDEAHARYPAHNPYEGIEDNRFEVLKKAAFEVEKQIFARCSIGPEDITDTSIVPIVDTLWDYSVL